MKKICLNCRLCVLAFPDVDIRELKAEDDYLICSKTKTKTEDYFTCKDWVKSKERELDIKAGC